MTYEQAINKIHSLDKFGSRPGLERISRMFSYLGDDLLDQKFIHVAGTNGKGSTCQLISNVLRCAGCKTGLFISPYITDFRERIQINNTFVSKQELTSAVEHMIPVLDKLNNEGIIITEFEFLTAVGFYIFKQQGCDIIVCETGLGGLLDSTNLIKSPICSVLTKIDFDHTAILGNTIEEITAQKCGIIKSDSITISATQTDICSKIITDTATKLHNKLYFADSVSLENINMTSKHTAFYYNGKQIELNMLGEHQLDNARVAICTLSALKQNGLISYTDDDLHNGFAAAANPARFELIQNNPVVILDGAHNINGISAFKKAVDKYTDQRRVLLVGMLADKDVRSALGQLCGMFDTVIATNVPNPRNMDCRNLGDILSEFFDDVRVIDDPISAFDTAYDTAVSSESSLLICGSLYLAGELRPHIIEKLKK